MWSTEEKNWENAEDFCKKEGGNLASITSKAIKDYVTEGLKTKGLDMVCGSGQTTGPSISHLGWMENQTTPTMAKTVWI